MVSDGRRVVLRLGDRVTVLDSFGELEEDVLRQLADGADVDALPELTATRFGPGGAERALAVVDRLARADLLEQQSTPDDIHPADLARFSRLIDFFSEFEDATTTRFDLLRRMRHAHVAVLGTGGMGSWTIYNLMCLGVGSFTLIDGDRVEASNLNRSILFTEDDIARPKVVAARDAVLRFAPRTTVTIHDTFIDESAPLPELLNGVDLLISCADQPSWLIREWVARAGRAARVPVLTVSGTRVGPLYVPGKTSCQGCDWAAEVERNPRVPELVEASRRLPRGTSGSLSPLAMMAAGPAMLDVLRFLAGYARPATWNAVLNISVEAGPTAVDRPPRPDCSVCHGEATGARSESDSSAAD
jgi:hypothetical protein